MTFGENAKKCPYGTIKQICGQVGPETALIDVENICFKLIKYVGAPLSLQSVIAFYEKLICRIFTFKSSKKINSCLNFRAYFRKAGHALCIWIKRALFSKLRAIWTWNLSKHYANLKFLERDVVQKKLKKTLRTATAISKCLEEALNLFMQSLHVKHKQV